MSDTISYDPPLEQHPNYTPETPELEVGQAVEVLAYSGVRVIRDDDGDVVGNERYLSEKALENNDGPLINNNFIVREIDGFKVKVQFGLSGSEQWIPRDRIVGVDPEKTAEFEERLEARKRQQELREKRENQDLDVLMEEIIIPHARKKANEVWPGGTVDVDEISWFWNHHLRSCAGRAYWRGAEPSKRYDVSSPAIGLSPHYYYNHGIDEMLEVVRHELIHIWQYRHENGFSRGGHGKDFKQWLDDMDTERYCKHYSR